MDGGWAAKRHREREKNGEDTERNNNNDEGKKR